MAIETKLDLSKIPAKETASKVIKADFYGDGEREYMIHALDDSQRQSVGFLTTDSDDVLKSQKFYVLLLSQGLDVLEGDQYIARYLLRNKNEEATKVCNEIYRLTQEFYDAKNREAQEAEKNSEVKSEEAPAKAESEA